MWKRNDNVEAWRKKEPGFNCDPQQLQQHVLNAVKRISEQKINDKSITLFLGPTRSGKSTLISFLLGNKVRNTEIKVKGEMDEMFLPENYDKKITEIQQKMREIQNQVTEMQKSKPLTDLEETGFHQMVVTFKQYGVIPVSEIIDKFLEKYKAYKNPAADQPNDSKSVAHNVLQAVAVGKVSNIGHFSVTQNGNAVAAHVNAANAAVAKPVSNSPTPGS